MILGPFSITTAANSGLVLGPIDLGTEPLLPLPQMLTPENITLDVVGDPGTTVKMFNGSSNRFTVQLQVDGVALDLSPFVRMVLKLSATNEIDSDTEFGIDWSEGDGKISFNIGRYLTGSGAIDTTMLAYRFGSDEPYVLWHSSLNSKLRIEQIAL